MSGRGRSSIVRGAGRGTALRASLMGAASPLALGLVMAVAATSAAQAQAVNLGGVNNILADGRTKTSVSVSGNTTEIHTETISNGTGFNSFSDFQQAAGTRVDLFVPDGAGNLVNIVRNGPVVIDGLLNSYKNGEIGGNVFFSSSQGFIVGANGTVNVGSLTVNTPTGQFLESVIGSDGTVNDSAAGQLMQGAVPISRDGVISISGVINAPDGISLHGRSVHINGQALQQNGVDLDHRVLFQSSVNTTGLREGGALVSRGGRIMIVATDDVRVGGTVDASAVSSGRGGSVEVRSGGDITIETGALIAADGAGPDGAGGDIVVFAGETLHALDGSLYSARGSGTGDGGFIELSGRTARIGAIRVGLSSESGAAGTLLFDPWDLYVGTLPGGAVLDANDSLVPSILSDGANVVLQADNLIYVNGTIDSTLAGEKSGDITLEAPFITIASGAHLRAEGVGGGTAGDITLDARAVEGGLINYVVGTSGAAGIVIEDGATLSGHNISLFAAAEGKSGVLPVALLKATATIEIGGATIAATGDFTASAAATILADTGSGITTNLGVVTADAAASIVIGGAAEIAAANAYLTAESDVTTKVATESLVPDSSAADGAVAVSIVNSTALVEIGGTAELDIIGALDLAAINKVVSEADATPNAAAFGASVGVSVVTAETTVSIQDAADVSADTVSLTAETTTAIKVTAKATEGGATEAEDDSETANYLDQYGENAQTDEGQVSVVGAFAVSDLTSTTLAQLVSAEALSATGSVSIASSSTNGAELLADASAVESSVGVGVALGINLARIANNAIVNQNVTAGALEATAGMSGADAVNAFSTTAKSGAGASNVGIAGSFVINLIDTGTSAVVSPNVAVTLTGAGALTLSAETRTEVGGEALPNGIGDEDDEGASGETVGIGASVALNILANRVLAEVSTDATIIGAGDVSLSAIGVHDVTTTAKAGSSGGVSLTPALALSMINNATTARLGTGGALSAGSVLVTAIQQSSVTTTASGKAAGSTAAVGAALALALVDDVVVATTARNITTTGGAVSFVAMGASLSELSAEASATGNESADENGDDDSNVDSQVTGQLTSASNRQAAAGVGDDDQQSATSSNVGNEDARTASTDEGKVAVAAAVGVNVQSAQVAAGVPDAVVIDSAGALTIRAVGNTDGKITADGSAVGGDGVPQAAVGIGVAVAVNHISAHTTARLGMASHKAGGLTVEALSLDIAALREDPTSTETRTNTFLASATSGAGASSVGIAGALGLNLVDTEASATVADGGSVTLTGGGDVTLAADNRSSITAKALPAGVDEDGEGGGASGGSVGIGASVALNIVANRAIAEVEDGAELAGSGDVSLSARGAFEVTAEAQAGAAGGVAITPVLALNLVSNTTTARIGTYGSTLVASGGVSLTAIQQSSTTTTASAKAAGGNVAIGAAVAIALVDDIVIATTHRSINATGAVSFTAAGASFSILTAEASAVGAEGDEDEGSDDPDKPTVDDGVSSQLSNAADRQSTAGVGSDDQQDATSDSVDNEDARSAKTSEGKLTVAAAVGVNIQNALVTAEVPDGIEIISGGTLTLRAIGNADGQVTSDGSAVGGEGVPQAAVGIGAAVSVNLVTAHTNARLGIDDHSVGGLTVEALSLDIAEWVEDDASTKTRTSTFLASATSGAGGSKVGIAGALGLNLVDTQASATVAGGVGANVTLTGGGDVTLAADNRTSITAKALPAGVDEDGEGGGASGGSVGIGASVALNIVANRAIAEIEDGTGLAGTIGDVSLSARGAFEVTAEAQAGAAGGVAITPVLALNLVSNTTTARIGSHGSALVASGDVSLSAMQQSSTTTTASAKAAGGNVAIGAAVAIALVDDVVVATTARSINAGGAVNFVASGLTSSTLKAEASASGAKEADDEGNSEDGKTVDDNVTDQLNFGSNRQQSAGVGSGDQQSATEGQTTQDAQNNRSAQSDEGKVSVAAGVAVNVVNNSVTAFVPDDVQIDAGGSLTIASANSTSGSATSDAAASDSQVGIGVAVSVNVVNKTNTATLGNAAHTAAGLSISATQAVDPDADDPDAPVTDTHVAAATSGAGGSKVGIAGALGLNIVNATTTASIASYAAVNTGTGDIAISASQSVDATASALPSGDGTSGGKVGVGASVALNLITVSTSAVLSDGVTVNNGAGLAVEATTALSTTTEAAAGASGGVAIDAVVALAMLDTTTTARIGSGTALNMPGGAVSVSATSSGDQTAKADGASKAGNVGVGAAAAVIVGGGDFQGILANTSVTTATLARNVTAASVEVSATSTRTYVAEATATAGGGKSDEEDSDKPAGNATSSNTLADTEDFQEGTDQAADNDGDSSTSGGKVQVAAAVGVAISQDVVSASIANNVTVNAAGTVSVEASNTTDMATLGSGQAGSFGGTDNAQVGVGIGVALAINTSSTTATIGDNVQIAQAGSVNVAATTRENVSEAFLDRLTARAIAGASSSKVSVAGAIAVGITLSETRASIGDNVEIVSSGDVAVMTDNQSWLSAKAMAAAYSSGNVGVGASIATVYSERDLIASIGSGGTISGADVTVSAVNREINVLPTIPGGFDFEDFDVTELSEKLEDVQGDLLDKPILGRANYYAEAMGGAAAPSGVAVQGSFAVMVFDDMVSATIGQSLSTSSTTATSIAATGDVSLEARNDIAARAVSGALAVGNSVGVGVSASVIVSQGETRAGMADNAVVSSSTSSAVEASASQDVWVFGIAAGGASTAGIAGVATVLVTENTVGALLGSNASATTSGDATVTADNEFNTISAAVGVGIGGTAGIGAGASVIVVENVTRAALDAGASLDAGGATLVSATSAVDALTLAAAGGVGGTVGAAVGAAVYVLGATTEALIGANAQVNQVTSSPGALSVVANDETSLITISGALGGGGTVGGGAGASVGVMNNTVTAEIGAGAEIEAGDVLVNAISGLTAHTIAIAAGVGGTAGLAGAASVFSIDNTTTARIGANAVVFASNNVAVLADDTVDLAFISGSLAGSGAASIGASASVAVIDSTARAVIEDGADVTALGLGGAITYVSGYDPSLNPFADSDDENNITAPSIEDEGDDAQDYSVELGSDGEVLSALEARRQGLRLLALDRGTSQITESATGVIVNATGQTSVRTMAVGGAASAGVSVSLSANVPVIDTLVEARIGNGASVDSGGSVVAAAASDLYRIGIAGSVGGGTVGIGGGVETAIASPTTRALIGNSTVEADHHVIVSARARQDLVGAAAAAGIGVGAAIAGGVSVFSLDSVTLARIGDPETAGDADVFAAGNVAVLASDVTRTSTLAGSVALDFLGAGLAGSIGVTLLNKDTSAAVAAGATVTALGNAGTMPIADGFGTARSVRGVVVHANSNESVFTLGISGAGGAFLAFAGAVSVHLLDINTTASIGDNASINTRDDNAGAHGNQDVTVIARNASSIAAIDGGLAVSLGGGIAGAVDVGILSNTTAASIGNGATVNTRNRIDVAALQKIDVNSLVISAAGGLVGIAAGVSVYVIGDGLGDDDVDQLRPQEDDEAADGDVGSYVQGQLDDDTLGDIFADSDDDRVVGINNDARQRRQTLDVAGALTGQDTLGSLPGTSATIGSATIDAGGQVSVRANENVATFAVTGAVAGGLVGIGAGVSVVTVDTANTARIVGGGSSVIEADSVSVNADSTHSMTSLSAAGGLALGFAAQAAIAVLNDRSHTTASIDGGRIEAAGAVTVGANADRSVEGKAVGAAVGIGGAAGISWTQVNLGGVVSASISGGAIVEAGSVSVAAVGKSSADAFTVAASGGLGFALSGAVARASSTAAISAQISGSTITADNDIEVDADAQGHLEAETVGFAVAGGLAVGASVSHAVRQDAVTTTVSGSTVSGGNVTFGASVTQGSASASASGSSGAFVGVTATEANAYNYSSAQLLASNSSIAASGALELRARASTSQVASSSGIAAGIVAVGDNVARARSNTTTSARILDLVNLEAGSILIDAEGDDSNFAYSVAGSGGVVAGTASRAETSSISTTRAAADTSTPADAYTIDAAHGKLTVQAVHTARFGGSVNSTQASAVGASGARLNHTVNSTVDAHLGDNTIVRAADLAIVARNFTRNLFINEPAFWLHPDEDPEKSSTWHWDSAGWNINSGSGGIIDAPAGEIAVVIAHNTNASIGANADIHLLAQSTGTGLLEMEAYNEVIAHQRGKLDSGGAVAVASTEVMVNVIANATTSIGQLSDVIVDIGDIAIAAWGQADLEARAVSTTYGLAGAPSGKAYAIYNGTNTVDIAENVRLEATDGITPIDGSTPLNGTVEIGAGTGPDGREASLSLRTTVDLFNNTAIPIDSTPDARSIVNNTSNLIVHAATQPHPNPAATYGVNAAGDISLRALGGNLTTSAIGIGKNIYLEAMSEVASAISNAFGGGDVTFEVRGGQTVRNAVGAATINGLINTGLQRHRTLTVSYATDDITGAGGIILCDVATSFCIALPVDGEIGYELDGPFPVGTDIMNRLIELNALLAQYGDDPVAAGAYRNEINFLERKLAALGLGAYVDGVFVPGAYAGPSPRQAFLDAAAVDQSNISQTLFGLGSATTVVPADVAEWADIIHGLFYGDFNIGHSVSNAISQIQSMENYADRTDPESDNYNANIAAALNQISNDNLVTWSVVAADLVVQYSSEIATLQAEIAGLNLDIQSLQGQLQQAMLNNDPSVSSIQAQIANKQNEITAKLGSINTRLNAASATIEIEAGLAQTRIQQTRNLLQTAYDLVGATDADETITSNLFASGTAGNPTSYGFIRRIDNALDGISYSFLDPDINQNVTITQPGLNQLHTFISTFSAAAGSAIGTLSAGGSTLGSVANYLTQLSSLTDSYVGNINEAATAPNTSDTPEAYAIDVDDVAARLGNVSVYADRLMGTGALVAPGDAVISITNNTANTLRIGNLLIPTYDAGRVRFNGVMVNSNEQINALNPAGTVANFASVVTSATSSRPRVSITSNYNPESLSSFNPASPLHAFNTEQIAPDIILTSDSVISNLTGAVEITSNAGNIYINGEILAGSVSILAKNGDFVSSYVNGFNHIGGDPGSFNIPTNWAEAGRGIIANGHISISARFLNINSTIQSGIAEWSIDIGANPTLSTTTASTIGLTPQVISDAIASYQADVTAAFANPASAPSTLISLTNSQGQSITLNMAPAGLDETQLRNAVVDYLTKVAIAESAGNQLPNPLYTVSGRTINIKDFLSAEVEGRLEFSLAQANNFATSPDGGTTAVYMVQDATSDLGVAYDAYNGRYVVDGTSVRGGYIQLYGQIMNTASGGGQLNVLDGFGTIDITNASDIPLVLQTLNAGDDPQGTRRGIAGVIEITDVTGVDTSNPAAPTVNVTLTRYTRDFDPNDPSAAQVVIRSHDGFIDQITGNIISYTDSSTVVTADNIATLAGTVLTTGGNRTSTYNPTEYQRYVWTTGEYFDNTTHFKVKQTQLFGSSSLTISSNTVFESVDGPHTLNTYRLLDGTYVTMVETQVGNDGVIQTNQGIVLVGLPATLPNSDPSIANTEFVQSTYAYMNEEDGPNETGRKRDCNWWTLCIASKVTISYTLNQKYTVIATNSLRADHPIAVNFIGSDTGGISVSSAGDIITTGSISASAGEVSLTSTNGSIVQGTLSAEIAAQTINLNAAGSVGGQTNPFDPAAPPNAMVNLRMTGGGSLTANAADGVVLINARSGVAVNQITAGGSVAAGHGSATLIGAGSITAFDPDTSLIQAPRVTLASVNGSIGSTADGQLLRVNTGFTVDPMFREFGDPAIDDTLNENPWYGLTATAAGDIGITSASWAGNADGTMLVDQVLSIGGDVRLDSTGRILDNHPVETIDSRTYDLLLDYWESLGLLTEDLHRGITGDENAAKQAATVSAFERSRNQAYDQYWQIRQSQPDGGETYDPGFAVVVQPDSVLFKTLNNQFDAAIRADNPDFTDQQVADAVAARIMAYEASQTQLYHELDALVGGFTPEFVTGFQYQATADEIAQLTRGAVWTERQLAFSLSAGALKTVTSTNPVVKDPNVSGRTVTINATLGVGETIGAGTSDVGVSIAGNTDPRDLTLAQRIALASAERSDLLLTVLHEGVLVDIPLGIDFDDMTPQVQAALLAAANGNIAATDMTIVVLSKRPLNFSAADALNVAVFDPPDDTTLDLGTAHLASRGNGLLGTIDVPGETRIKVLGTIVNAAGGSAVNTGNIVLEAALGGVGAGFNPLTNTDWPPLQIALRDGATFTARAQAGVNVEFTGSALIDTVYSPQDVRLVSTGSILNANQDLLINILGTDVILNAEDSIGTTLHALNVGNNLGGGITVTATGLINLFGSAGHEFRIVEAESTTASIRLTAALQGVIDGPVSAPGRIDIASGERMVISGIGQVHSFGGMIDVRGGALKMINGATMIADIGRIIIDLDNDAVITGVLSGSDDPAAVSITVGGRVFAGTDPDRAYDISAMASGAGVYLHAALGIGDKTQANERWQDGSDDTPGSANLVTDEPNPLRLLTGTIDVAALDGSIYLETLAEITAASVVADTGDIYIWGMNSFYGQLISAVNGHVMMDVQGDLTLEVLRAKTFELSATGALKLDDIEVAEEAILRAGSIEANITQVPPGPPALRLTLTGYNGTAGTWAKVEVDAPAGLIVDALRFHEAELGTTATSVSIIDGYITGSLLLRSPLQTLLFENRTPLPVSGNNVQMFQPDFAFSLNLDNYRTITDAYIVRYDTTAQPTNVLGGLPFDGASLVRDTIRVMNELGIPFGEALLQVLAGVSEEWEVEVNDELTVVTVNGVPYPIHIPGREPAVQLSELGGAASLLTTGVLQ